MLGDNMPRLFDVENTKSPCGLLMILLVLSNMLGGLAFLFYQVSIAL